MLTSEALSAALSLWRYPQLARRARQSLLPKGMTFLLEVAAGDEVALHYATNLTDQPKIVLQEAAGFFVEQVLLTNPADSYRTLGASRYATAEELRRHMALLMRWLHPDLVKQGDSEHAFDRSLYVIRVTKAWESIKTDDRRAAYDLKAPSDSRQIGDRNDYFRSGKPIGILPVRRPVNHGGVQRQLLSRSLRREPLWRRILLVFRGAL